MSDITPSKDFFPALNGRALDVIKICAAVFMVIDHINVMWLHDTEPLMTIIGRGAFPLFCYAMAVALYKAGPEKGPDYALRIYSKRILIAALLTEPVSLITRGLPVANVLFTLCLGAVFAGLTYRMKDWQIVICHIAAAAAMAFPSLWEFGTAGVALPSAILLVLRGKKNFYPTLILLLLTVNIGGYMSDGAAYEGPLLTVLAACLAMGLAAILLPYFTLDAARNLAQSGRLVPKYFLYAFYPGHMILLWLIGRFILGVS